MAETVTFVTGDNLSTSFILIEFDVVHSYRGDVLEFKNFAGIFSFGFVLSFLCYPLE